MRTFDAWILDPLRAAWALRAVALRALGQRMRFGLAIGTLRTARAVVHGVSEAATWLTMRLSREAIDVLAAQQEARYHARQPQVTLTVHVTPATLGARAVPEAQAAPASDPIVDPATTPATPDAQAHELATAVRMAGAANLFAAAPHIINERALGRALARAMQALEQRGPRWGEDVAEDLALAILALPHETAAALEKLSAPLTADRPVPPAWQQSPSSNDDGGDGGDGDATAGVA